MMNRAEQKLVLELCRCHNPNTKQIENLKKQGVDEAVVLGQLLFHRKTKDTDFPCGTQRLHLWQKQPLPSQRGRRCGKASGI